MSRDTFRKMQNAVCSVSTGSDGHNKYFDTVGHAVSAVDSKLLDFDCRIDPFDWAVRANGRDFSDPNGQRIVVECTDGNGSHQCDVVLSFYRMQSGRYELTAYLA